jgi:hypothetical protein
MLPVLPLLALLSGASPRVAVVDVEAPGLMMGLAAQVTRAVVTGAQAQGLDFINPEQLRVKLDPKQYEQLKKCGGNVACAAQLLEGQGAERAVLGTLDRDERHYRLKLWLVDLKGLTVIADVDRRILIAARRFEKDVEQAVPPLLRGEREARGTLVVESNVADAQVIVDGDFIGTPPVTLTLKPGKYEVKVDRKKYLGATRLVAVEAGQETKEFIKLLLKPGEIPDEQLVPALTKKAAGSDAAEPPPMSVSALTWIAGGLTVAAGATGLGFGLLARSQERALVEGFNEDTRVYQGTRAEALEQNRNALIANVAFVATGVAAAATVVSVIIDATRPSPAVQVTPVVTPGGAGVTVGGRF